MRVALLFSMVGIFGGVVLATRLPPALGATVALALALVFTWLALDEAER